MNEHTWIDRQEYPLDVAGGRRLVPSRFQRLHGRSPRTLSGQAPQLLREWGDENGHGGKSKLSRPIHQHHVQPLANPADRQGCWVLPKEIIASTDWLRELWEQRAKTADKPALILWALNDIAFREKALKTWQQLLTDGQAHLPEGVGHFVQEEYGREAVLIIEEFLT